MKLLKPFKLVILPIMILILTACKNTPDIKASYEFDSTIKVAVLAEDSELDFIDLILEDPSNQLDKSDITYDLSSVNLEVIGIYTVDVRYIDEKGDSKNITITVEVVDEEKPVVSGLNTYTLNLNSSLPNFLNSITATDNYDGNITLTESNIDSSQVKLDTEGRYNVKLTVSDKSGNEGVFNITVIVVNPDTNYIISYTDTMNVPQYSNNYNFNQFVSSVKDANNHNLLEDGFILELNSSGINTNVLGEYTLVVNLKDPDGNIVKTENKTVKIVNQVTVQFKANKNVALNNQQFKPEDLIDKIVDYNGATVNLGTSYILSLDKTVDVTTLGAKSYVYTIKDNHNNILYSETITITIKYPYEIIFTESFKCTVNSTCDLNQFITGYIDMNGQSVDIQALGLTLQIEDNVNSAINDNYTVTYQLLDSSQNILYSRTINLSVNYEYNIEFIEDLTYKTNYFESYNINYSDYIKRITDKSGNEVTLGNEYKLIVDGSIDVGKLGTDDVTYILVKDETILFKETIHIDVILGDYYHLVSEPVYIFEKGVIGPDFNYLSIVDLYIGDIKINYDSTYTYGFEGETVNPNIPTDYSVQLILFKDDEYVAYADLEIIIIDPQYQIIVSDDIKLEQSMDETFNVYSYVTNVQDTNGQSITFSNCNTTEPYLPMGACQLDNGLKLIAAPHNFNVQNTPSSDMPISFFVVDLEHMLFYGNKKSTFHFVNDYIIDYSELIVPQHTQNFDLKSLIQRISTKTGTDLVLGQDVFIEVLGTLDTSVLDSAPITFVLKDQNNSEIYRETVEVDVIINNYNIVWNKTALRPGEYTSSTFDPSLLIDKLYLVDLDKDYVYSEIPKENYSVTYKGEIDFNVPGIYNLWIRILNNNNSIIYGESISVEIKGEYDFIFKVPQIELDINQTFTPNAYVFGVYHNGIRVDHLPEYTLNVSRNRVDTSYEDQYRVTYNLFKGTDLMARESIDVIVRSSVILKIDDVNEIEVNDPDFVVDDLVMGIYDRNDNVIDSSRGYYYTIEHNINITLEGDYFVKIKLYDSSDYLLKIYNFYPSVESNYVTTLDTEVDINEAITSPSELVVSVFDESNYKTLVLGQDYQVFVEGPFDLSSPDYYTYTFILKDLEGNILSRFERSIRVVDATYVIPKNIEIEVSHNGNIILEKEATSIDIKQYVTGLYDENGKPLDPNLFTLTCKYCDIINFGTSGTNYISVEVSYNPYPNVVIGSQYLSVLITEGYDIVLSELSFNLGEFNQSDLIANLTDPSGQTIPLTSNHEIVIAEMFDESVPGTYNVTLIVYENITWTIIAAKYITFEILPLADIVFSPNTIINLGDISFNIRDLILGVNDLSGAPIDKYSVVINGNVDVNYSGQYEVDIAIYDEFNNRLTYETFLITVGDYQIELSTQEANVLVGTPFDFNTIQYKIIDNSGNEIDINSLNYTLSISDETPYDTFLEDLYILDIVLKDHLGQIVARTSFSLEVYSNYIVDLKQYVDVSDGITAPSDLLWAIYDEDYLIINLGSDYEFYTEEPFDLSIPGYYTLTFVLIDKVGTILSRFVSEIRVTDISYVVPSKIEIRIQNDTIILNKNMTEENFNINDYVIGLYNEVTGEPLRLDYYTIQYSWELSFGVTGKQAISVNVFYKGDPINCVAFKPFSVFITESYSINTTLDLTFDLGQDIVPSSLVTSVLDADQKTVPITGDYVYILEGYDKDVPGIYDVTLQLHSFPLGILYGVKILRIEIQ